MTVAFKLSVIGWLVKQTELQAASLVSHHVSIEAVRQQIGYISVICMPDGIIYSHPWLHHEHEATMCKRSSKQCG